MKLILRLVILALLIVVLIELPSLLKASGRETETPEQDETHYLKKLSDPINTFKDATKNGIFVIQPSHFNQKVAPHFPIRNR